MYFIITRWLHSYLICGLRLCRAIVCTATTLAKKNNAHNIIIIIILYSLYKQLLLCAASTYSVLFIYTYTVYTVYRILYIYELLFSFHSIETVGKRIRFVLAFKIIYIISYICVCMVYVYIILSAHCSISPIQQVVSSEGPGRGGGSRNSHTHTHTLQ